MSDVMLFGVLRMPYKMAMSGEISRIQFYDRAQQAADRIESLEAEVERLRNLAANVASPVATPLDVSMVLAEFDRLSSIPKTPGYCDGTKFTRSEALAQAIALEAAARCRAQGGGTNQCTGCEGSPSSENNPCKVCGAAAGGGTSEESGKPS